MKYFSFLFLFIFLSCVKSEISDSSLQKVETLKKLTLEWMHENIEKYGKQNSRIRNILENIDINSINQSIKNENENIIVFKIGKEPLALKHGITSLRYGVNYYDLNNNLVQSKIIDVFIDSFNNSIREIDNLVADFIKGGRLLIEARIQIRNFYTNSIEKLLTIDLDGTITQRVFYQKYGKIKNVNSNKLTSISASGCIDWYIITTYTFPDGTQYTTEEYIGRTCDECIPDPNFASVVSFECGLQSGGADYGLAENLSKVAKLCAEFSWVKVGQSYTASARGIANRFHNTSTNQSIFINFPQSCITIPHYNLTPVLADKAFNDTYNHAAQSVLWDLEMGLCPPTEFEIKKRLKNYADSYLRVHFPGAVWTVGAICAGNIPITDIHALDDYCF